ncbi:MAG: hypothetical protein ABSC50_00220 [Candidatus Bathyarchaeia archaeon]
MTDLHNRAVRFTLVTLLAVSFGVGLNVAASNPTIFGTFLDFLAISFLTLCPVCAKGSGYRAVVTLGAITSIAAIANLWSKAAITPGGLPWFDSAAWVAIQVALVWLANSTYKSGTNLSGVLKIQSAH